MQNRRIFSCLVFGQSEARESLIQGLGREVIYVPEGSLYVVVSTLHAEGLVGPQS